MSLVEQLKIALKQEDLEKMPAFGIDLGTSRSGIAVVTGTQAPFQAMPIALSDDPDYGQFRMPSIVPASSPESAGTVPQDGTGVVSAKSSLGTDAFYMDSLNNNLMRPEQAIRAILAELAKRASSSITRPQNAPVAIAVPASMPETARRDIVAAAGKAGLRIGPGYLVEEPVAVLLDLIHSSPEMASALDIGRPVRIAVYDFGAGTCDTAVFEVQPDGGSIQVKTLAIGDHFRLGGDNFDEDIAREALAPLSFAKTDGNGMPESALKLFVERNRLVARELKEELLNKISLAIDTAAQIAPLDYPKLTAAARTVELNMPDSCVPARDITLGTERLMKILAPYLSDDPNDGSMSAGYWRGSLLAPLYQVIVKARIKPAELDLLVLAGASCRAPFVQFMIRRFCDRHGLKSDRVVSADLDCAVMRGAALHARIVSQTDRPPVTPVLSGDIGVWVYGDRPEPLVRAGTALPYPASGEKTITGTFFVPEANLSRLIVELYSNVQGREKRRLIRRTIDLPSGVPAGAAVNVSFRIDESKLFHFRAALADRPHVSLTISGDQLQGDELDESVRIWRERVSSALRTTGRVSPNELLSLASAERDAATHDSEARANNILSHVLRVEPGNARAWNQLGLLRFSNREYDAAELCFRKAMAMDRSEITYRTNVGHTLLQLGRSADAVKILRAAHSCKPSDPRTSHTYARALEAEGQDEKAEEVRRKAVAAAAKLPMDSWSQCDLASLALMCDELGEDEQAEKYRKAEKKLSCPAAAKSQSVDTVREALLAGPDSPADPSPARLTQNRNGGAK